MSAYVSTKSRMSVQTIAKISILGALAFLVMMFEIPLPFAPDFYKLGFDEVIVLIGGFALGPWAAVCIESAHRRNHYDGRRRAYQLSDWSFLCTSGHNHLSKG